MSNSKDEEKMILIIFFIINISVSSTMIMKESYHPNISSITLSSDSRGFSQTKQIFEELLEGFNCESPENVESHEFETVEKCEDDSALVKSSPAKMQILQRTTRYMNKGIKCSLVRTKKLLTVVIFIIIAPFSQNVLQ